MIFSLCESSFKVTGNCFVPNDHRVSFIQYCRLLKGYCAPDGFFFLTALFESVMVFLFETLTFIVLLSVSRDIFISLVHKLF